MMKQTFTEHFDVMGNQITQLISEYLIQCRPKHIVCKVQIFFFALPSTL